MSSFKSKIQAHIYLIVFIQIFCLCFTTFWVIYKAHNTKSIDISALNISTAPTVQYNNNIYYLEDSQTESTEWTNVITANNIELEAGSYTLYVYYQSTCDRPFSISDGNNGLFLNAHQDGILHFNKTTEMYRFITSCNITDFSISINSRKSESDHMHLSAIKIISNTDLYKRNFFVMFIVFFMIDILFFFFISRCITANDITISVCCVIIIVLSSLPLFLNGIAVDAHDIQFHLMRIETLYTDLKRGAFPVRINSSAILDYGYPVSLFYGDIILYPFAVMRMFGFTITECTKALILFINLITVLISYYSFKHILKQRHASLAAVCAYTLSPYRLTNIYVRAAFGEACATAFIPLIALAIYRIYSAHSHERKQQQTDSSLLAIGMSALICTHILSTEITIILLMIHMLIFYKQSFSKAILKTILLAIIKSSLICSYFIVPFIDTYVTNPLRIYDTITGKTKLIQNSGVFFADYFMITHSEFKVRYPLTPGIILIAAFVVSFILILNKKNWKEDNILIYCFFMSAILLYASSQSFPWNKLASSSSLFNKFAQIQFPFRLLTYATLFLCILLGKCIIYTTTVSNYTLMSIVFVTCFVSASLFTETYERETDNNRVVYTNTSDIDTRSVGGGEYLRSKTTIHSLDVFNQLDEMIHQKNGDIVTSYTLNATGITLECHAPDFPLDILVPKFNYKGYHVYDDYGNEYEVKDGIYDLLSFKLPAGYTGNVYIKYIEPWYWRLAEIISAICILIIFKQLYRNSTSSVAQLPVCKGTN